MVRLTKETSPPVSDDRGDALGVVVRRRYQYLVARIDSPSIARQVEALLAGFQET